MDEKLYKILKTLSEENRIPTTEEIGLIEEEYKNLLLTMERDAHIINLRIMDLNVNTSTANITIQGYYYINNWETTHKIND